MSQNKRKNKKEEKKAQNAKERIQKRENKVRATRAMSHLIKITNMFMFPPVRVYIGLMLYSQADGTNAVTKFTHQTSDGV